MVEMTFSEWLFFIQKPEKEKEEYMLKNTYITPII